jgi:threonine aldolase
MADAEVGDDGNGEDPTVNRLQEMYAELTGKEAALFVPSGTMANQIALRALTRPGDAVVAGARQHVVVYEGGAGPLNAGVTFLTVPDERGVLDPAAVAAHIESGDYHQPKVTLVAIEDTHMASGGRVWPEESVAALRSTALRGGVSVHLDGARLWNASVASGRSMKDRSAVATTVMSCLSKGLSAPVGSLLAGPLEVMSEARLHRQRLGGAMRQVGVLAAAGIVAIRDGFERLAEDHVRARKLAEAVADRWPESGCSPEDIDTNIVAFTHPEARSLVAELASEGVLVDTIRPGVVRMVTHADLDDACIERACRVLAGAP